jgi:hypothetical protein
MDRLCVLPAESWNTSIVPKTQCEALNKLEDGLVLYFPHLKFAMAAAEARFLSPTVLAQGGKNISYDTAADAVGGTSCIGDDRLALKNLMARYADSAGQFLQQLLPHYTCAIVPGRTSLRPAEIDGRPTSWRKDDTRLHVDSFPSQPTQGRRLLRVFCNVSPNGHPRTWRIGEPFPAVAEHFWKRVRHPIWGERRLLHLCHVTKSLRSQYDHYMLQLHDAMKADVDYQRAAPQITHDFPPGSTWICFTDQVSHAAMAGQHLLEQTFTLPADKQCDPAKAPVSVLERLAGRRLAPLSASQRAA